MSDSDSTVMVHADDSSKSQTPAAAVLSFLSRDFSEAWPAGVGGSEELGLLPLFCPSCSCIWFSAGVLSESELTATARSSCKYY